VIKHSFDFQAEDVQGFALPADRFPMRWNHAQVS
jgi:hypothetical protein